MKHPTILDSRLLRLNVGFLLKQGAGYSRDFVFDVPQPLRAEEVIIHQLHGTLRLTRTPQGILIQGTLHAQTTLECVRCLSPFEFEYEMVLAELFTPAMTPPSNGLGEDNPYVIEETDFIDLTPIVREETILAAPIQALCRADCKGLCPQCGQDLNQGMCRCDTDYIDPRLASLRALLEDD